MNCSNSETWIPNCKLLASEVPFVTLKINIRTSCQSERQWEKGTKATQPTLFFVKCFEGKLLRNTGVYNLGQCNETRESRDSLEVKGRPAGNSIRELKHTTHKLVRETYSQLPIYKQTERGPVPREVCKNLTFKQRKASRGRLTCRLLRVVLIFKRRLLEVIMKKKIPFIFIKENNEHNLNKIKVNGRY